MSQERTCPKCKLSFPIDRKWFKYKKNKPTYCRTCWNKHYQKPKRSLAAQKSSLFEENKKENRKRNRNKYRKLTIEKCRNVVANHLKSNPCQDCGENDWVVLEFDHRDPKQKIDDISKLMGKGKINKLLEEIKKCDVVCANCHNKRTYKMNGSWRLKI